MRPKGAAISMLGPRKSLVAPSDVLGCRVIGHRGGSNWLKLVAHSKHHCRLISVAVRSLVLQAMVVLLILSGVDRGMSILLQYGQLGHLSWVVRLLRLLDGDNMIVTVEVGQLRVLLSAGH